MPIYADGHELKLNIRPALIAVLGIALTLHPEGICSGEIAAVLIEETKIGIGDRHSDPCKRIALLMARFQAQPDASIRISRRYIRHFMRAFSVWRK